MKNITVEFEKIKEEHQTNIETLDNELEDGYLPDMLKLRKAYSKYIFDLNNLFDKYDYIAPYELYKAFYQVSVQRYNLLFGYSECINSGNLAGAFFKEAVSDFELWSVNTLLQLESNNNYKDKDPSIEFFSIQAYDIILETKNNYKNSRGYAIDEQTVSEAYAHAAHIILSHLGSAVADKAFEYYKKALALLKESSADSSYHSWTYYTYYIALYDFLLSYKSDIEEYGVACDFDIDQEMYECMYNNYRQAQTCSRDKMITQVNNLIKHKCYAEACQMAKEIVDICEERIKNVQVLGVKLSLKNAYELLLSIPELTTEDEKVTNEKLNNLLLEMTHEDFYCKDGEREYPRRPY